MDGLALRLSRRFDAFLGVDFAQLRDIGVSLAEASLAAMGRFIQMVLVLFVGTLADLAILGGGDRGRHLDEPLPRLKWILVKLIGFLNS